jgi:O-acetyl-ADP-ribose deacetylase (regulator of RNase III)
MAREASLIEEKRNVFDYADRGIPLAHCIASDLRMGAGIAVAMQKRFGLRGKIRSSGESLDNPTCVFVGKVFNLITKARSSGKPTYMSLRSAVQQMAHIATENDIRTIAMPRIGCGLDRLSWPLVREMLQEEVVARGISVIVCRL